ncbi:MAG: acetone carboxylase subunit alpha [Gammaproteobacteria bacterium]|nr:MAG: acetone carboxylase subunit alpha [Gammaproteobacteria bacterium]
MNKPELITEKGSMLANGKSLYQHRRDVMKLTKDTGHYAGLVDLAFKKAEPITFEKVFSKLRAGVVNARETAKKIAASPIVEQEGELCFTLYNAAGDCICTSTGIIIHVGTMGAAIKYMIENNWESNPGINPGDMFTNNDCQIGNVHPCDICTIVPIFHEGNLIAWVGGVTHVIDTGAVGPGSMSNGQIQRFGDGLQITCRKTGINDVVMRDWQHESQRNVRTPKYWILDERTRIAGDHMIRDIVGEVIEDVGIEAFLKFGDEIIEDGRRGLVSRIHDITIPGKYHTVAFVDVPYTHEDVCLPSPFAKVDTIMHAPCTITIKPECTWRLDFDGCSRWGWHTYNANPTAFTSGIWVMMTQTLVPTERINDGAMFATEFYLPKGTWTNPNDRRTAHSDAWHFLVSSWSSLWRAVSRGYFARGYLEEVNAGNSNPCNWMQGGGFNQEEEIHAVNSFETAACGTGACAMKDGLNHAAAIWNPEGDMGDCEIWELAEPLLYLGRAIKSNTGGYGKYRGGMGFETLRMVHNSADWTMFFMGNGYMNSDWGLMGGYPSATGYRFEAHNTGLHERIAEGKSLPSGHDYDPGNPEYEKHLNPGAQVKRDSQCITTEAIFENGDLYLNYLRGGPGFGDPLDRKIEDIQKDLNDDVLLEEFAVKIYGAVFSKDSNGDYVVDSDKTLAAQKKIRKDRISRGVPVKAWMETERQRILDKDASTQVQQMFASSFELSQSFLDKFREFWDLPSEWLVTEKELGIPTFGSKHAMDLSQMPDVSTVVLVEE